MLRAVDDLLKRYVCIKNVCIKIIKIIGGVYLSAVENLNKLSHLMKTYSERIENRHEHQPLRGFIVDGKLVRLKDEKEHRTYRQGEMKGNLRVFYE